ncbi:MAG: carbohydrate ABC transporter permease [Oscillospiraceae bacterium]
MRKTETTKPCNRIKEGTNFTDAILIIMVVLLCVITLYPFYYVLIMSISDPKEVIVRSVSFYPKGFQLDSYALLVKDVAMWKAYFNTIIYVGGSTILVILTSVLGAYPLTIKGLPGRKWVVGYMLIPMYFGGGLIPTYLLMTKIGLYDNIWAIIIPAGVSIWYIILVRTFFSSLPEALRESAYIDGATDIQIMFRIYVPMSKPILAVIAIYAIVGMWNSWFGAMVYLPNIDLHPLQMYLQRVLIAQKVDLTKLNSNAVGDAIQKIYSGEQLKYAMIIFTTLPIIFTYPFFQKYFIKGVMIGSLKE